MKKKYFLLTYIIIVMLVFSCVLFSCKKNNNNSFASTVPSGKFWLNRIMSDNFNQITAELLAEGKYCTIWTEKGLDFSLGKAREMADTFDNVTYPRLMNTFSNRDGIAYNGQTFTNIMELADWLGDGDGKLRILLFNRVDSVSYFLFTDLAKLNTDHPYGFYSNRSDMIYIAEGTLGADYLNGVIAHETTHLINYVTGLATGREQVAQDLWINEGIATTAEWLYHDGNLKYRWWLRYHMYDSIGLGNIFFNTHSENPYVSWQDYFSIYLFFSWLRLQAGSCDILHDIITSRHSDYRAVTEAADRHIPGQGYDDWGTILKCWLAANYINAPDGPYGYMNDSVLKTIRPRTVPPEIPNLFLAPGEGVFSSVHEDFNFPAGEGNIRYAGLRMNPPELSDTAIFPGGVLLTYNANADIKGETEKGMAASIPASNLAVTKFEGEWKGSFPHSSPSSYNQIIFTGNTFVFRTYENGQMKIFRSGTFAFTEITITFIPAQTGSWNGYTQIYSLNNDELTFLSDGRSPYGTLTRQ